MPRQLQASLPALLTALVGFLLPSQLGYHIWPLWSYLSGLRVDYLAPTLYLSEIGAVILFTMAANRAEIFTRLLKYRYVFLLGGVMVYLNILFSHIPILSLITWMRLILWIAIGVQIGTDQRHRQMLLWGLAAASIFQLVLVLGQLRTHGAIQGVWYWLGERAIYPWMIDVAKISLAGQEILRPYGTFSHPNTLGGFFLAAHTLFLVTPYTTGRYQKLCSRLRQIALVATGILVFLSFSKTATTLFVVLHIILVFGDPVYRWCRFCVFARPLVFLSILALILQAQGDSYTWEKRQFLISHALTLFEKSPIFGVGLGTYVAHTSDLLFRSVPLQQPVHMVPLLILAKGGITAIMTLVLFGRQAIKYLPHILSKGYLPLLMILLTGLNDHYWLTQVQGISLVGMTIGYLFYQSKDKIDDKIVSV